MLLGARVTVVVPAFDEEARIAGVLERMPSVVDRVIVVDDASGDGTAREARRVQDARIEVLSHERNRGVGAAIASGYLRAMEEPGAPSDAFVVMAGDGQMDPGDLPRVVAPIARGEAGYVKGNRFDHPDARAMPLARRLGGEVFSRLTSVAVGFRVRDSQCGYTAIARWACERFDPRAMWPRFGYPNDLLGTLAACGVRVAEVPVRPIYAGEKSGLRPWHLPTIAWLVARGGVRRMKRR